ncbi:PH domain-containing protein [Nocardia sp. NPDC052566]|uniref:PH domain-containing protein n=1 Tax=Nocardia sp. NPDC052566 TaxID=3364330 RepID=UPI0037C9AA2D
MPPVESSHTSAAADDTGAAPSYIFQVNRVWLIAVFVLAVALAVPVALRPLFGVWFLVIPLALLSWVLRVRTALTADGLVLRSLLRTREVPWSQVAGIRLPEHGYARVVLNDGGEAPMPAVGPDDLERLVLASRGRIADPGVRAIRITQLAYLGVIVLLFCVFFFFVGWPIGLWWLLLIPAALTAWVTRTRTVVTDTGLDLRTVFGSKHLDWARVAGVRIPKRGFVRAHLTDESEVKLPAVSYDRLRELIDASKGRIPDLFAAAAAAQEAARQAEKAAAETKGDAPREEPAADN